MQMGPYEHFVFYKFFDLFVKILTLLSKMCTKIRFLTNKPKKFIK